MNALLADGTFLITLANDLFDSSQQTANSWRASKSSRARTVGLMSIDVTDGVLATDTGEQTRIDTLLGDTGITGRTVVIASTTRSALVALANLALRTVDIDGAFHGLAERSWIAGHSQRT